MPSDGGEARQLTCKLSSVEAMAWSPDSSQLVFLARARPEGEPSILNDPDPPPFREIRQRLDGINLFR